MTTQGLAAVLSIVVLTSLSSAQTPAPGVATDPRLTPVPAATPVTSRGAPWLRIDESKRQYYVYKSFAPPDLAAKLDRPVADAAYRALLSKRAAAFRSGTRTLRLAINADSIIDVGSERPEDANTVAAVDLDRSPELLEMVRNELKVDPQKSYVMPFLSSMYTPSAARQEYRAHDEIIVSVVPTDLSQVSVWRLSDGRWQRLHQATAGAAPAPDRQAALKQLHNLRGRPVYQGYMSVVAATNQISAIRPATMEEFQEIKKRALSESAKDAETSAPPTASSTYTAYGRTGSCNHYCSSSSCNRCCLDVSAAAQGTIVALAVACHFASDFCPWCHFGCAANTTVMTTIATNQQLGCQNSCRASYEALHSQGNPKGCPVH